MDEIPMPPRTPDRVETARDEVRRQLVRNVLRSREGMVALGFVYLSIYAAFASFGIEWARLAGSSAWEAAVWPVALTAVTAQALHCWLRVSTQWHPGWLVGLCGSVAAVGFLLALVGVALHPGDGPQPLHPAAETLVRAAPGFALLLSATMGVGFLLTARPFGYRSMSSWPPRVPASGEEPTPGPNTAGTEEPAPWWKRYDGPATSTSDEATGGGWDRA